MLHIEDYENDLIKKHEKTRRDKGDDRTKLIDTISANTGPVFLTYRDVAEIDALVDGHRKAAPYMTSRHQTEFNTRFGWSPAGRTWWRNSGKFRSPMWPTVSIARRAQPGVGKERREANAARTGVGNYN